MYIRIERFWLSVKCCKDFTRKNDYLIVLISMLEPLAIKILSSKRFNNYSMVGGVEILKEPLLVEDGLIVLADDLPGGGMAVFASYHAVSYADCS